jgi:hypothetical protein
LKRDNINIQNLLNTSFKDNRTIERIEDQLDLVELKKQVLSFINSLQHSSVRKELKEPKLYERIKQGIISLKSKENWEKELKFISSKSARFKSGKEVLSVFETMVRNVLGGYSAEIIASQVESTTGATLVYNKDGFVVAQVFTREASCSIGSSSWCISGRSGGYFKSYANPSKMKQQFFIWDTSKPRSNNYSQIGVTLYQTGRAHTAHLKNDDYFDHLNYFRKLHRQGLCDEDLVKLLSSSVDVNKKRNAEIEINYMIYGGKSITVSVFKKIFKEQWNKSKRENIDDFINLYNLFETVVSINSISIENINQRNNITYKRILMNLVDFAITLDMEEVLDYLRTTDANILRHRFLFIDVLMITKEYNQLDSKYKLDFLLDVGTQYTIDRPLVLEIEDDTLSIEKDLKETLNRVYIYSRNNMDQFSFQIRINKLKTLEVGSTLKYMNLFFPYVVGKIETDKLIFNDYSSQKIQPKFYSKIKVNEEIIFNGLSNNYTGMGRLLKASLKTTIINSNINFNKSPLVVKSLKELTIRRCIISGTIYPSKILNIKYSDVSARNINPDNHIQINLTSDIVYNNKDFKDIKYNIIGGLPIYESLNSIILRSVYKHLDRTKIKKFFNLLSNNGIDLKNVTDEQVKYIPSFKVKQEAEKEKLLTKRNFTLICVNEDEGIKYVINYRRYKPTYGSSQWKINFFNDNMTPVSSRGLKDQEVSDLGQNKLPSYKDIVNECDYVIMINNRDIPKNVEIRDKRKDTKSGSPHFMDKQDFEKDKIKRLDQYIKDKYVFEFGDDKYNINYINTIIKRISSIYNILNNKTDIYYLMEKIDRYVKSNDDDDKIVNNIGLPVSSKSNIKKKINDSIHKLLLNSKSDVIPKYINNFTYKSWALLPADFDDKKIYPSVDKLSRYKNTLINIENTIRDFYSKNPINIEFINDLDVFRDRVEQINTYINSIMGNIAETFVHQNEKSVRKDSILGKFYTTSLKIKRKRISVEEKENEIKNALNDALDELILESDNALRKLKIYLSI